MIDCIACARDVSDHSLSYPCIFNEGPSVPVDPNVHIVHVKEGMYTYMLYSLDTSADLAYFLFQLCGV